MGGFGIKNIFSERELPRTFIRFYCVGLLLFIFPYTRSLFIHLISYSLLFVIGLIFALHKEWNKRTILLFCFIAASSFALEWVGVNTGSIFGRYAYGSGLGVKIEGTPLLIGLNWVFLVYASQAIVSAYTRNVFLRIGGGAVLMVVYDLILEAAAPPMMMWSFNTLYPPINNFIVWFLAAFFYHSLMVYLRINVANRAAAALFVIQGVFFVLICLYSSLFL